MFAKITLQRENAELKGRVGAAEQAAEEAAPEASAQFFREHFAAVEVARIRYPDWLIIRVVREHSRAFISARVQEAFRDRLAKSP